MRAWYTIFNERIHFLIPRPLKWQRTDPVKIGDVVLFLFNETPGSKTDNWKLGVIRDVPKKNSVSIEYTLNGKTKKILSRCPRDVSIIVGANELPMNSLEYYKALIE